MKYKSVEVESIEEVSQDYVVYSDTDSVFVEAVPIIKKWHPEIDLKDETAMTEAIMEVTNEVQKFVNLFYDLLADKLFNLKYKTFQLERDKVMVDTSHIFEAKQEVISKTSFWLVKKRYCQWIIHKEGRLLPEPELEIKGIDVVRSSFPTSFRRFMKQFLIQLLNKEDKIKIDEDLMKFEEEIKTLPVVEIAKNTSVKFVSQDGNTKYDPESRKCFDIVKGTPAQARAALYYNDLLEKWKLNRKYEKIHHGTKVKWVYLKDNEFNLSQLAMKADGTDPKQIMEYIENNVDRNKMYEQELKGKLEDFYLVMKWDYPNVNMKKAEEFFNF
jgi:hypothetical protein